MTKAESAASRTPRTDLATFTTRELNQMRRGLCANEYDAGELRYVKPDFARTLELEAADLQRQVKGVIQALTDAGFTYPVHLSHTEQDGTPVTDKLTLGFTVMLAFDDLRERLAKARAEAIEECARVCDRFASRNMHPAECAGAIRALAQPKGEDHGNG